MLLGPHQSPRPGVPRLRGVSHKYAFFASVPAAFALIVKAGTATATVAAIIYAIGLCGVLGVSALYHRGPWSPRARVWMRRLDHSMIFVLIAGSYTPFALISMHSQTARTVLIIMWLAALVGVILKLAWIQAPDWVSALVYTAVGGTVLVTVGELLDAVGAFGTTLLALGGLCYAIGAVTYATKWPRLSPRHFGYHEVFHLLVIAGAALHYVVIAAWVI